MVLLGQRFASCGGHMVLVRHILHVTNIIGWCQGHLVRQSVLSKIRQSPPHTLILPKPCTQYFLEKLCIFHQKERVQHHTNADPARTLETTQLSRTFCTKEPRKQRITKKRFKVPEQHRHGRPLPKAPSSNRQRDRRRDPLPLRAEEAPSPSGGFASQRSTPSMAEQKTLWSLNRESVPCSFGPRSGSVLRCCRRRPPDPEPSNHQTWP
jgi:hypothetical protein